MICFGSDFWVINCVRFIVDLKRPALAGIYGSCVAWGFGWPETICLGKDFWIINCVRCFVDQSRLTMPCAKGAWRIHCKILLQSHIVERPLRWLVWVMKTNSLLQYFFFSFYDSKTRRYLLPFLRLLEWFKWKETFIARVIRWIERIKNIPLKYSALCCILWLGSCVTIDCTLWLG